MPEFYLVSLSGSSALWPIHPGWGLQEAREAARHSMRTRDGKLYAGTWEHHFAAALPLAQVSSAFQGALAGWWRRGDIVAWVGIGSSGPQTALARVSDAGRPLGRRDPPEGLFYSGTARLEGIGRDGDRVRGAPFILDHVRFGTLDTHNVLL
jgi:hypothetical protein